MKFNKKRSHILIIFEQFIEIPLLIAGLIIIFLVLGEINANILTLFILIMLSPISRFVKYFTTYYYINDKFLVIDSGIFNKKHQEIPLKSITTVDFSQNLLFQLFKVYKINVENSSETMGKTNILLALKKEEAIEFKRILLKKKKEKTIIEKNNDIKISFSKFILKSLLDSKIAIVILLFCTAIGLGVDLAIINQSIEIFGIFFTCVIIFLGFYIASTAFYLLSNIITYFNFKISLKKDSVIISYGLITKKSHTIKREKLTGVVLKQSLLMKLFNLYTLEAIVIGFNTNTDEESQNEKAILLPLGTLEEIKDLLNNLEIKIKIDTKVNNAPKKALKFFYYNPLYIFLIIGLIIGIYYKVSIVIGAVIILTLILSISNYLSYKNSGIKSNKLISVFSSGSFTKQIFFIKTKEIETVTSSGSKLKLYRNLNTINIGVFAPLRYRNLSVRNVEIKDFNNLKDNLNY